MTAAQAAEHACPHCGCLIGEMPPDQRPVSEQYRIVAKKWVDAENAAKLLEETKTTVLEQHKTKLIEATPNLTEARAERLAKQAKDWRDYVVGMCRARGKANLLKVQLRYIEMKHREWIARDANARSEQRMLGGHP